MGYDILLLSTMAMVMSVRMASNPSPIDIVTCTKGSDCPADKCCVFDPLLGSGVCQPMLRFRETCHPLQPYAWVRPVEMVTEFDRCPCETGDFCATMEDGVWGICSYG